MPKLIFDQAGSHKFETGVKNAVLFKHNGTAYGTGVAWNGITAITEQPSGAEATPLYADDIKYLNLISAEEFGASIEAYTYPDEFAECDGSASPIAGMKIGQQKRLMFGLAYKTIIGNDEDPEAGFKLHLIYGAKAAPSEKPYATVNDSPEAITLNWELTTTPVEVGTVNGTTYKPTSYIEVDSTKFIETADAAKLQALMDEIYGGTGQDATSNLPTPAEVYNLLSTGTKSGTVVTPGGED